MMIGEIRDLETAQIALQAALTGHLVLSTVHTNNAASAVTRLLDMGVEPYLLPSTLNGVLAQRLVRKLCPVCKEQADIDVEAIGVVLPELHGRQHVPVYRAVGCVACGGTGYRGRSMILERHRRRDFTPAALLGAPHADALARGAPDHPR